MFFMHVLCILLNEYEMWQKLKYCCRPKGFISWNQKNMRRTKQDGIGPTDKWWHVELWPFISLECLLHQVGLAIGPTLIIHPIQIVTNIIPKPRSQLLWVQFQPSFDRPHRLLIAIKNQTQVHIQPPLRS